MDAFVLYELKAPANERDVSQSSRYKTKQISPTLIHFKFSIKFEQGGKKARHKQENQLTCPTWQECDLQQSEFTEKKAQGQRAIKHFYFIPTNYKQ